MTSLKTKLITKLADYEIIENYLVKQEKIVTLRQIYCKRDESITNKRTNIFRIAISKDEHTRLSAKLFVLNRTEGSSCWSELTCIPQQYMMSNCSNITFEDDILTLFNTYDKLFA